VKPDALLYSFLRIIMFGVAKVYWRVTMEGRENLPARGGYVLAPIHRSNVDTPLTGLLTRRRLRYIGKDSLWKIRPIGWVLSMLGAFPVRRGTADRDAIRQCIAVTSSGEPLVMFPEGTRREGPVVADLFHGPAFVASRTGVPIIPVGIGGSERTMPRGAKFIRPVKIHMIVGRPIEPPAAGDRGAVSREAYRKMTTELHGELQRLFDLAQARALLKFGGRRERRWPRRRDRR
jgi:1-acyl-sn-glycerol-3-phosphate acyltransferase